MKSADNQSSRQPIKKEVAGKSQSLFVVVVFFIITIGASLFSSCKKPDAPKDQSSGNPATSASDLSPDACKDGPSRAQAIYDEFNRQKVQKVSDEDADKVEQAYIKAMHDLDSLASCGDAETLDRVYAYKFNANSYMSGAMKARDPQKAEQYDEYSYKALKEWAARPTSSNAVKAYAYFALGSREWIQASNLSREYETWGAEIKLTQKIPLDKVEQMRPRVEEARKYLMLALRHMPEWNIAHSMLRLTIRQEIYLLDSQPNPDRAARESLYQTYQQEGELAQKYMDSEQSNMMREGDGGTSLITVEPPPPPQPPAAAPPQQKPKVETIEEAPEKVRPAVPPRRKN